MSDSDNLKSDLAASMVAKIGFTRIAFFSSHGGSSMRAIVEACGREIHATPELVISNNPDSAALAFARSHNITNLNINVKQCGSTEEVNRQVLAALKSRHIDLIILSGYMKLLGSEIVEKYNGRIFNIHPALLPKYGGKGMWGIHVHEAVLRAGETETGITIHEVNARYDEGQIIAQIKIPVHQGDTPESLAERVKREEPPFLVKTLMQMQLG